MADGLALRATSNVDDVVRQVAAFASVVALAITRTVNKLADQAETAGLRTMSRIYRIPQATFRKYISVKLAQGGGFVASVNAKGSGLPLYLFNPRQVRGKGGGVRVTLKGRTFLIPHAFIAIMKSGHAGIFARGAYGGKGKIIPTGQAFGRFQFGKKRFSINELFTFSAPGAFSNREVTDSMTERVTEQTPVVFAQELRFAAR